MTIADYDQVYGLWTEIKGFGIRSIDDSREGVERFLGRTAGPAAFITCAWRRDTGNTALDTAWCALPWRPFRRKESAKSA